MQDLPMANSISLERIHFVEPSDSESYSFLGVTIAATSMDKTIDTLIAWLERGTTTKLITFANVHMITEAYWNPKFNVVLRQMDMNCPDGMPLVWIGKLKGHKVSRVAGPDFMPAFCAATADRGFRHFFYGGNAGVAEQVASALHRTHPNLPIAGWMTPPFGEMTAEEDARAVEEINNSGADVVWVCLGCPKQEMWLREHRDRLNARLILSVGMAFDITAGLKSRAPEFLRAHGLEWLYRMITEPRRLAKRYLLSNLTLFYLLTIRAIPGRRNS